MDNQCMLCGEWLPQVAFYQRNNDCQDCRWTESMRPSRGAAPIEQAMTPAGAKQELRSEIRRISAETCTAHVVGHVIPIRGRVHRNSDDWILICGLDVPDNWQIIPARASRGKRAHFSAADAAREEARLARLNGGKTSAGQEP